MTTLVLHKAIGGPVPIHENLLVLVLGYLGILTFLVVFGIWGFLLGSRHSGGNPGGGGGPKRPTPTTPPPGGQGLDEDRLPGDLDVIGVLERAGLEEGVHERDHDLVASRRG
jgi:hypothetical protein